MRHGPSRSAGRGGGNYGVSGSSNRHVVGRQAHGSNHVPMTNYCSCRECGCNCPGCRCSVNGPAIEDSNRDGYAGEGGCGNGFGFSPCSSGISSGTYGSFRGHEMVRTTPPRTTAPRNQLSPHLRALSPPNPPLARAVDTANFARGHSYNNYNHDSGPHFVPLEEMHHYMDQSLMFGVPEPISSAQLSLPTTAITRTTMSFNQSASSAPSVTASEWLQGVGGFSEDIFEGDGRHPARSPDRSRRDSCGSRRHR